MRRRGCELLLRVLREPGSAASLALPQWDVLVRQAKRAQLLSRLHCLLAQHGLLEEVPPPVQAHLSSAHALADKHERAVRWELERIDAALRGIQAPVVLLKGAAYLAGGLAPARGRLFGDVDIMVPHACLAPVEQRLLAHGWMPDKLDAYDQRYYRRWMHELPPLRHRRRGTVLDVHHTIVPPTAPFRVPADSLFQAAVPIPDSAFRVLAREDMVLHSAAHLFTEGELVNGLRDLVDLDDLLREFGGQPGFWSALLARARTLDVERLLFYGLRYAQRFLATPVPDTALDALRARAPGPALRGLMDALYARALLPDHASCSAPGTGLARWLLYVRGHYLRMPLYLLVPHLMRKAVSDRNEP